MCGKAAKVVISDMQLTILKTLRDPEPYRNDWRSAQGSF